MNSVFQAFKPTSATTNVVEKFAVDVDNDFRAAVLCNEIVLDVFCHIRLKAPKQIPDNKLKNYFEQLFITILGW